jgi:hypothetical protein
MEQTHGKAPKAEEQQLDPATHRRILTFLNEAVDPEDLVHPRVAMLHAGDHGHDDLAAAAELHEKREALLTLALARELIAFRDEQYPLGFRNLKEVEKLTAFTQVHLVDLIRWFGWYVYGRWSVFPQRIPRRGNGGMDGVVHAGVLHTGKVLFVTADETTLLWNPEDTTAATFENPLNQPDSTPDTTSGYSVLCGGHSFLSDGRLLVAGGGGYGPNPKAKWGYVFDPVARRWSRTAGSMSIDRWYPTVVGLGDHRLASCHEALVVDGDRTGSMEIYDEDTDSFRQITSGDDKPFPSLYPGLHLLPNHTIFYSRTGWGSAGPGSGPFTGDDQSSYFTLTGASTGGWTDIAPVEPTRPDRTKGMSVMLLSCSAPYARVMVIGGADPNTNDSYEIFDASTLSSTANWGPRITFPDGEHRSLSSAVLLPDGSVFIAGGILRTNSPCASYDPETNTWSSRAALPSIRDYHSVAVLLPSAEVAMAGWNNDAIEIFRPPYLFHGPRPVISSAPAVIYRGRNFTFDSPQAGSIAKVVLVRPMAITHQTDPHQRVLELTSMHDPGAGNRVTATAPDGGGRPHSLAPQGHYMLFAISHAGVPSVAAWVELR